MKQINSVLKRIAVSERQRTALRPMFRTGTAVLLLVLLLPYLVTALVFGGSGACGGKLSGQQASRIKVRVEGGGVVRRMDMETYLTGALAASIPAGYEEEALKAQAVLLRTALIREYKAGVEGGTLGADGCVAQEHFMTVGQMRGLWGKEFAGNYEKVCRAVRGTRGIYAAYGGAPILASYFRVSGGQTKDMEALTGDSSYPYLKSVACPKDYLSGEYLAEGEAAGLGHGVGMSQFAANEMAKSGDTYHEILTYFFTDIAIDKFE